jgi:hypothetical protein
MDLAQLIQQFGFPVALAAALVYWWRRDYNDIVKRLRHVEDGRVEDQKTYANSFAALAERATDAMEEHNRLTRMLLRSIERDGQVYMDTTTPKAHPAIKTPLPFDVTGGHEHVSTYRRPVVP